MKMNRKLQVLSPVAVLLVLTGCGLFGDKEEDRPVYFEASETDYLTVPKGLNEPRRDKAMLILGNQVLAGVSIDSNSEPPRVQRVDGSDVTSSGVKYGARGSYLLIAGSVESVYTRLTQAIESSGMELLDQNEARSSCDLYYAHPPRSKQKKGFFKSMLFWRKGDFVDYSGNYRTQLESDGEMTRIYLQDMQGKSISEGAAEAILGQVLEHMS